MGEIDLANDHNLETCRTTDGGKEANTNGIFGKFLLSSHQLNLGEPQIQNA